MLKPKTIENQKFSGSKLVGVLFYTFPLWFIIGNLAVSINTLLFIAVSLFLIKKKQLTFRFNNLNWLLIIFFLYFFISTTIQFLSPGILNNRLENLSLENNPIFKSFVLLRFLVLVIVIDTLYFNKIINLEKFFLSSLICTSFVCSDIFLQYVTGFDLFGYKRQGTWNTGPFGNEWIAGSYLKNFSFFSFFYIFKTFKNKNFNTSLLITMITLHLTAILLSGNKMPLLLFLFGCVLIILLIKNFRFVMSISLLIFVSIFFLLVNYDSYENTNYYKTSYKRFLSEINIMKLIEINKDTSIKKDSTKTVLNENYKDSSIPKKIILLRHSEHNRVFQTAIRMWKKRPFTGFGLKSFRFKCWDMLEKDNRTVDALSIIERKIKKKKKSQYIVCANHPHNYYLELLSEAGIIGTSLLLIFFLILLKNSFHYLKKYKQQINYDINFLAPVIILFFLEIWPLKSTGSFFTTWGATFFWINVGLLITGISKNPFNSRFESFVK